MAARKPGLGRGLSALLDDIKAPPAAAQTLPVAQIRPNPAQPRRRFDAAALEELAESVKERGVLQPILVRPRHDGGFEIVAGERRWRAAQAAGLHDIPVLVRELDDAAALEVAIVENVQRADLNPIEEAEGYRRLTAEFGHKPDAIGRLVGKSRSHVANLVRLLDLPAPVRAHVVEGRLTMGHARALLTAPQPEALADAVIAGELSVRETEARAAGTRSRASQPRTPQPPDPDLRAIETTIERHLGVRAKIGPIVGNAGGIELRFRDLDQLDLIVARLTGGRV